jgi:uncharacterized phage protein gp47/JayE
MEGSLSFQVKKFSSILASMINWVSSSTDKITDFNKGSVVRTLLESVAMELEELYYQLQKATEEAIEEAIYRTFNFPRNPAKKATGTVRFTRISGTTAVVTIPIGSLVGTDTDPSVIFETQADETIPSITGTATGGSTIKLIDTTSNFTTLGVIAGSIVYNLTDGGQSVVATISTTTNTNDSLNFSALSGGNTFTSADSYRVVVPYKDISVIAVISGEDGNVAAASVIVLKSNISNILSVNNSSALLNGAEEETDTARKNRFSLYIQSLARATKGALEYAARTISQIVAARAIDDVRPTVFVFDSTGASLTSGVWTDISQAMRNPGDEAVNLLPSAEAENDMLYIGADELFNYVNMHLVTPGEIAASPDVPVWEYYTSGSVWDTLSVTDGTDDGSGYPLTQDGTISWTIPGDWVAFTVNGSNKLWIRLRIADSGSTYSVIPTGDYCSLPPGLGYVNLYCHDGSGELSATLQTSVENVVDLYRGCGIIVNVLEPIKNTPTVTVEVFIASNYAPAEVGVRVNQAIVDHLNAKVLGEDLYVAELYQLIMDTDTKAITNVIIAAPLLDIIVASSGVLRADTSKITVTATGV